MIAALISAPTPPDLLGLFAGPSPDPRELLSIKAHALPALNRRPTASDGSIVPVNKGFLERAARWVAVNASIVQKLDPWDRAGDRTSPRCLNIGEAVYQIRNGTGVGVGTLNLAFAARSLRD
jgi:hypothetical protein